MTPTADVDGRSRRRGAGFGPFTGGQLTVVIVAIAAVFAIPTAALAASGAFTNNSATVPALTASNSNAQGIGVQGAGAKFGVLSNGPLGVAAGKPLSCTGCVGPGALSGPAKAIQPLVHGQAESGMYAGAGGNSTTGFVAAALNYARPLSAAIAYANIVDTGLGANAHCPGIGFASAGYLCLYPTFHNDITTAGGTSSSKVGAAFLWFVGGAGSPYVAGEYTVTAP